MQRIHVQKSLRAGQVGREKVWWTDDLYPHVVHKRKRNEKKKKEKEKEKA